MENLPLAVTNYQLSLWIHITAAVVGLGMTFAEAILFLIRNEFVTGTTVDVDGGALLP